MIDMHSQTKPSSPWYAPGGEDEAHPLCQIAETLATFGMDVDGFVYVTAAWGGDASDVDVAAKAAGEVV